MRNYLAAGIALGLLAGCSPHQDQAAAGVAAPTAADSAQAGNAGLLFTSRAPMSGLASLPDRGELLAYEKGRQVKHKAAYTAYPVAISEAHALNAMRTGEMVINAPNGEQVHLTYERHEEGKDGNWTWIGRNADGASAVITFGEKAVFGVIPQGATETLRLTMSAGRPWLVQTDRSKLAGMGGEPRREGGDQLIPPKLASAAATKAATATSMQGEPATASASASAAVVDVLLGYTNGFASQLGGQSAAVTRLVNMIAITNAAYDNSGVNMRVRLVKTLQVNYADNTDNGDALEKLTGYKSGSGPITPDPAFDELRETRDEVGADLVSLVRAFRTPENAGCGIAWLLGGDETGIDPDQDAEFGYSVVSDGTDIDEDDDNTYFCREETLAHELGHNMGQAHNEEDSDGTGVHAYSYGYRESSSTGFYTVMAYPQADGSQFSIRYFANPNIKYSNRATGVANKSDNVRSLNQTMPLVSTFRATKVPIDKGPVGDVNGDRKSDLLWSRPSTGQFVHWLMNGTKISSGKSFSGIDHAWKAIGTGDLDGDGHADIVWKNVNTGGVHVWLGNGSTYISKFIGNRTGWDLIGVGDVNGDARSDLLWSRQSTGQFVHWLMNGASILSGRSFTVSSAWRGIGVGDLNGDGKADVIWKNDANGGHIYIWTGNGSTYSSSPSIGTRAGWTLVAAADVDSDGKDDLLWSNQAKGLFVHWKMDGAKIRVGKSFAVSKAWRAVGVGDFNGGGYADIVWKNDSNGGQIYIWSGNGSSYNASPSIGSRIGWSAVRMP